MKILSIGNSFSQDAHNFLHKLAKANGAELTTANLYIGGCSLETHHKNVVENNAYYDFELNGGSPERKISIKEALELDRWDIITLQQVSQLSGIFDSYEPYLTSLASMGRKAQPNAKIYFHQTWAYEIDSTHGGFTNYNNNQTEMYRRIIETSEIAAKTINAEIIPSGKVIQTLREDVPLFDYKNGGLSLCRDGFHLSLNYGRYAVAATWLRTLTKMDIKYTDFEDFEPESLRKILNVVNSI